MSIASGYGLYLFGCADTRLLEHSIWCGLFIHVLCCNFRVLFSELSCVRKDKFYSNAIRDTTSGNKDTFSSRTVVTQFGKGG